MPAAVVAHDFTVLRTPHTLGDKLQRLALLSPKRLKALEVLVDMALEDLAKQPDLSRERIYP